MKKYIFDSFKEWRICLSDALKATVCGMAKVVSTIVLGIVSIIVYAARQVNAFCRRETTAALIIGALLITLSAALVATFVTERTARVSAEYQRDSIAYKNTLLMQAYDAESTLVVNGDTVIH